ncbi:hypothetical protein [Thiomicrorhabdus sp.]|uniref:hypothetical protein n=1 Tax=Thiomicrorhabdus sp. TaxID=2039724 RepID=UPI0029C93D58|nr:hypothetical protein [Thiomicrorhabdus sp.]
MVTFIATLIIVVLALLAFALGLLLSLPKELRVAQSRVLQHPERQVAELISNLNLWHKWNPWLLHDPQSGSSEESAHHWNSHFFGKGRIESDKDIQGDSLHFMAEFKGVPSRVEMHWEEQDSETELTWKINGRLPWHQRWKQFKLQNQLKQDLQLGLLLVENQLAESPETFRIKFGNRVELAEVTGISQHFFGNFDEIGDYASEAFEQLFAKLTVSQQPQAPLTAFHKVDLISLTTECEFFIPLHEIEPGQEASHLPGGAFYRIDYYGAQRHLELVWNQALQHLQATGIRIDRSRPYLEEYLTDPKTTAEDAMHTVLYLPIK